MSPSPGTRLGPYEILAPIGKGGMGEVFKATDTRLGRAVAIKFLHAKHSDRLEREARSIAALNHPHICAIYDVGPDYLVMEYLDGAPLRGPFSPPEAVRFAVQIAEALEAAHAKGIIHRDLKPGNIFVTAAGVKLLDFGLAKLSRDHEGADATQTMTQAGTILGTAAYMSPEQAQGKPIDARSDIFSFGLVLYEMLSGQRAFDEDTGLATMAAIVRDEPKPLTSAPELQRIIARCIAKQPAQRYQTMAEIRTALSVVNLSPAEEPPSIAVLPFANMSGDKDNEYFSDGLSEEIINALAHMPGLKVTARTSAFAFRGKEQDITKIAETLRVKTVLEGSVRRAGNRIRVMAQLINASDGYHLWSERYDRDLTDVFAVQDEIAAAIAAALKVKLAGKPAPAHRHTPKLPAYEAYLKGLHHRMKTTPESMERAREFFELAIAIDPDYPDAHVGLSDTATLPWLMGLLPAQEGALFVRTHARKALALDPAHPYAHAMLGSVAAVYEYDWKEAEREFHQAFSAEPVPPLAFVYYCIHYLLPLGRSLEAVELMKKALESDPLNTYWRYVLGASLNSAGMYDRALQEVDKILEIDQNYWLAYAMRGQAYQGKGNLPEALAAGERVHQLAPWLDIATGVLAGLLARMGERSRAESLIQQLKDAPGAPCAMTLYHSLCNEPDIAADWFQKAIEQRNPFVMGLSGSVSTQSLRDSPRWPALAKMMNLPPAPPSH